jgi:iron-sulfur cluster assembly accessory protein
MAIHLTSGAVKAFRRLLDKEPQGQGFRLIIEAGGCAGLSYRLQLVKGAPSAEDILFEIEGIRLWVPSAHLPLIDGLEIDHPEGLSDRGFVFRNPQARQTCGCGTSFAV